MKIKRFSKNSKGFSLLELLIASSILILMLLGLEMLYLNTAQFTHKNKLKNNAQALGKKVMEEYRTLDFERLKSLNDSIYDGQIGSISGTEFNKQISVDFLDQDWPDEDNDGDQTELLSTDNETNIMRLRVVISDKRTPKRIDDIILESFVSEGGHTNLPQFKITINPQIAHEGNVTITILASESLDPNAASGNPLDIRLSFLDASSSGNIYSSGGFAPTGNPNEWSGIFTVVDDGNPTHNPGDAVEGDATIIVKGRNMPGQPVGLWGIEKKGFLIDTYDPTYRNLIPDSGSSLSSRKPLISVIFKDEGNPSYAGSARPRSSLLNPESVFININGQALSGQELNNVTKITQSQDPGLSEYELKVNYTPSIDLNYGSYTVDIGISDLAGNSVIASTTFNVSGPTAPDNVKPIIYAMGPVSPFTGQISSNPSLPVILTDKRPTISAYVEDHPRDTDSCLCATGGASGIDPSSIILRLNGNPVSHTYTSGYITWTPSSDLSLDYIYEVSLNVDDNGLDFTDDSGAGYPDGDKYDSADNVSEVNYNVDINGDGILSTLNGVWEHSNSADEVKWYFKITTNPIITSVFPTNGEKNVSPNTQINVYFSKEMNVQSVKNSLSVIGSSSGDITSSVLAQTTIWSSSDKRITFNANSANIFQDNETYTITISSSAQDEDGLNLEQNYTWSFATPDTIPPYFWHNDHTPPQDGQIRNTSVTLRLRSADNIELPSNKVYLYYQNKTDDGFGGWTWSGYYNIQMPLQSWNVTNKDGEFIATIDSTYIIIPTSLSEGMLQYYFKAQDASGNISYFDKASVDGNWTSSPASPFSFTIGPPPFIFFDDFDGGISGNYTGTWTHYKTGFLGVDDWEVGPPQGKGGTYRGRPDPTSAHSGANCYGNDLSVDGDYQPWSINYLVSPTINCSGYTNIYLVYYRWLNIDKRGMDKADIEITNGGGWFNIFMNSTSSATVDSSWVKETINISTWADNKSSVRIRFRLQANGSNNYSGWNIDDITIKVGP